MPAPFLNLTPEQHGLSESLCSDIRLIDRLLGRVVLEQEGEHLVEICRTWQADSGPASELIKRIPALGVPDVAAKAARALTVLFQLINIAEQKEIVRVNRLRRPRRESIREAVREARELGVDDAGLSSILAQVRIEPTLTAHPTEAKRREVLDRLHDIALALGRFGQAESPQGLDQPLDLEGLPEADLYRSLTLLWQTPEVSRTKLTVSEEAANVRHYFRLSILDAVSWVGRDLEHALSDAGCQVKLPDSLISYRSWVGGDRDGNPLVTHAETLETHRVNTEAYRAWLKQILAEARRELSVDEDLGLTASLDELEAALHSEGSLDNARRSLEAVSAALLHRKAVPAARTGRIRRLQRLIASFGLSMAALDIRQHSERHEAAVAELLAFAGAEPDYSGLAEERRQELLTQELLSSRPLAPSDWVATPLAEEVRATARAVRQIHGTSGPSAAPCWIISMTHGVSDLLEVGIILKDAGLVRLTPDGLRSDLQIVPLLETIHDLESAPQLLDGLFSNPAYRQILAGQGMRQEVMLGYSDSTKDGGFLCANWSLFQAQEQIAEAGRRAGVQIDFFHGRGGTVGRGGGRASRALRSQPPGSFSGRVRFTEQGEVIGYRYGLPPIAHRHLEQIVGAVILEMAEEATHAEAPVKPEWRGCMSQLAAWSQEAHRSLIEDPAFWSFYTQATPIELIADLPIASRPVMRPGKLGEGLAALRAVPWNFAWVQSRYVLPGWFGLGAALRQWREQHGDGLLKEMASEWRFFQTLIENVELELGRCHLETAEDYASLVEPKELGQRFHDLISQEHASAVEGILVMTQRDSILQLAPVVRQTIEFRNPLVRPLNRLQACLRHAPDRDRRQAALLQTVAGLAAAMQSTG